MSQRAATHRVTNPREQPVELHCGGRTLVVAPQGTAELAAFEVDAAQIRTLARRGLIELRPLPEAVPEAADSTTTAAPAAASATRKPKRNARVNARGGNVK